MPRLAILSSRQPAPLPGNQSLYVQYIIKTVFLSRGWKNFFIQKWLIFFCCYFFSNVLNFHHHDKRNYRKHWFSAVIRCAVGTLSFLCGQYHCITCITRRSWRVKACTSSNFIFHVSPSSSSYFLNKTPFTDSNPNFCAASFKLKEISIWKKKFLVQLC